MLFMQNAAQFFEENLAILAPIMVIQLLLIVTALISLIKTDATNGPKWMWVFIIIFISTLGPITYFIFGRRNDE